MPLSLQHENNNDLSSRGATVTGAKAWRNREGKRERSHIGASSRHAGLSMQLLLEMRSELTLVHHAG